LNPDAAAAYSAAVAWGLAAHGVTAFSILNAAIGAMTTHDEAPDVGLGALCQACGLCCDGSLFGRARLASTEVASARRLRLPVVASETAFALPCPALATRGESRHCTVYEDRPEACRQFVCELHARREEGRVSQADALAVVRRARALLASLDGARVGPPERDAGATRVVGELTELLEAHFARANTRLEPAEESQPGEHAVR
jgi:hypothetical protein